MTQIHHFDPEHDTLSYPLHTVADQLVIYRGDAEPLLRIPMSEIGFPEDKIEKLPEFLGNQRLIKQSLEKRGYIYVITNKGIDGWVKIGSTVSIQKRLGSYQTSDPFRRYRVNFAIMVDDRAAVEKWLHHDLGNTFTQRNEWIESSLVSAIEAIVASLNTIGIDSLDAINPCVK